MRMDAQTANEKNRVIPEGSGKCLGFTACIFPGWIQCMCNSNSQIPFLAQCCKEWQGLTASGYEWSFQTAHQSEQILTSFKNQINPS